MPNTDRQSAKLVTDDADTERIFADVSDWSEDSKTALAEVIEGLAQLEECIGDTDPGAVYLARFRRSMFTLVRDLRSRDLINPVSFDD